MGYSKITLGILLVVAFQDTTSGIRQLHRSTVITEDAVEQGVAPQKGRPIDVSIDHAAIDEDGNVTHSGLFLPSSADRSWIVSEKNFSFAHEAPVWIPESGELFFASNRRHLHDGSQRIDLFAITLRTGTLRNVAPMPETPMPNGATPVPRGSGPFPNHSTAALAFQGYGTSGGGIAYLNMETGETRDIITGEFPCLGNQNSACQLNSPNDVAFNADGTGVWFTDTTYGHLQNFRNGPLGPQAVYFYDLQTDELRYAARHFDQPNGVMLSPDGTTVYITDAKKEFANPEKRHRVVAMDINPDGTLEFRSEYPVGGFPDGIKASTDGSIWVGTSQGVEVLTQTGEPVALINVPGGVANLAFGGEDFKTLLMLNENRIIAMPIKAQGEFVNLF